MTREAVVTLIYDSFYFVETENSTAGRLDFY